MSRHSPTTSPQGPDAAAAAPSTSRAGTANARQILWGGAAGATCCPWLGEGSHAVLWGPNSTQDRTQGPTPTGTQTTGSGVLQGWKSDHRLVPE